MLAVINETHKTLLRGSFLLGMMALFLLPLSYSEAGEIPDKSLDLAGKWRFQLDPENVGEAEQWNTLRLLDHIDLPGSTDKAGKSLAPDEPVHGRLERRHKYVGAAWYQREVEIPDAWAGQHLSLLLERCHWVSDLWVNDQHVGSNDSLSVPHRYDLSDLLTPGVHTLTVRIDNTPRYGISEFASSVTEHSQSNWNGIIGEIAIQARPKLHTKHVRVNIHSREGQDTLEFVVQLANHHETTQVVDVSLHIEQDDRERTLVKKRADVAPGKSMHALETTAIIPWDEFAPDTAQYTVTLRRTGTQEAWPDRYTGHFGMRRVTRDETHIIVNERPRFLRGTLEAALHPQTGHPPMDTERWEAIFDQVRAYGLNHVRFHAWCPPRAAFLAADKAGVYIQAEAPWWGRTEEEGAEERMDFLRREAERILAEYGNHPSFILFSMGNELSQPHGPYLSESIRALREKDGRRLYTAASGHFIPRSFDAGPFEDDFFLSLATPDGTLRGQARFDAQAPETRFDYRDALHRIDRPIIIHELGQWSLYPDLGEADKYQGPLRHIVYERAHAQLREKGMLHLNRRFTEATGAFMVELYKEEIESAMRTPDLAGYQMLGLSDQTGWGTAVIGLLDAFWEDKGLITPAAFRQFSQASVPLLRMPKRVWEAGEVFEGELEIHHFGAKDHEAVAIEWELLDETGGTRQSGDFMLNRLPTGGNIPVGDIHFTLPQVDQGRQWTLRVQSQAPAMENHWKLWVYPDSVPKNAASDAMVTDTWAEARTALDKGEKVLYQHRGAETGHVLPGKFTPIFWAFAFNPTNTFGVLADTRHPALAHFATAAHSDWQWWELMQAPPVFILDETPTNFLPIVQVVDSFNRNQKLGLVFEAQSGEGRLLATGINIMDDLTERPVARELLNSLLRYMESDDFTPATLLPPEQLDFLFTPYPLHELEASPPEAEQLAGADLHVLTAVGQTLEVSEETQVDSAAGTDALVPLSYTFRALAEEDAIQAQEAGFSYRLTDLFGALATDWFWIDHRPTLEVRVPKGYEGVLRLHFVDWNHLNRRTRIRVEGELLGDLQDYGGAGVWLAIPLDQDMTYDGAVSIEMDTINGGNTLLRAFAVTPKPSTEH